MAVPRGGIKMTKNTFAGYLSIDLRLMSRLEKRDKMNKLSSKIYSLLAILSIKSSTPSSVSLQMITSENTGKKF